MTHIRRLAYVALAISFAQIVFGAIVRISGSGLGCGNHWPKCNGAWIPHFTGSEVIIEVSHRYGALAVSLSVLALVILVFLRRSEPGVAGRKGPMHAALAALALVITAALLGAVTVKLDLPPQVVVLHLAIAMLLLAAIATVAIRAGGFGAGTVLPGSSPKTARSARAAAIIALVVVALGGMTANVPGAATSCRGFPHCAIAMASPPGGGLHIHLTHRVLAILLVLHMIGVVVSVTRRDEPSALKTASRIAMTLIVIQVVIAVVLVTYNPTPGLRSLHQATGTAAWLSIAILALLARRGRVAAESHVNATTPELVSSTP